MSRIPTNVRNLSEVQFALRMVDERLSQLDSVHGRASQREFIQMQQSLGDQAPAINTIYPEGMIKAWANTANDGTIINGFNLSCSQDAATDVYFYSFKTPVNFRYSVVVTPLEIGLVTAPDEDFQVTWSVFQQDAALQNTGFAVVFKYIWFLNYAPGVVYAQANHQILRGTAEPQHSVMVIGRQ